MAKLNINYVGINGGTPGEALRAMTGMPVAHYPSDSMTDEFLWDQLTAGTKNKYPMGAGTNVSHHGLIEGHAYSVLGAYTLNDGGKKIKLVKMRNPWGSEKYHGDWSDKDPRWTAALKA